MKMGQTTLDDITISMVLSIRLKQEGEIPEFRFTPSGMTV